MDFEGRLVKQVLSVLATPKSLKPFLKCINQHVKWQFKSYVEPFMEPSGFWAWAASFLEQLSSALLAFMPTTSTMFAKLHALETGQLVRLHYPVILIVKLACLAHIAVLLLKLLPVL